MRDDCLQFSVGFSVALPGCVRAPSGRDAPAWLLARLTLPLGSDPCQESAAFTSAPTDGHNKPLWIRNDARAMVLSRRVSPRSIPGSAIVLACRLVSLTQRHS